MKKFKSIFIILIIISVSLCGCDGRGKYTEPNNRQLVSALGFDNENGMIRVFVEFKEATSEQNKSGAYVLSESGEDTKQAIARLSAQSSKELLFTHCGAIILGNGLTAGQIGDILGYCSDQKDVSLSTQVVATDRTNKLFSAQNESTNTLGTLIVELVESTGKTLGYSAHSSLYEINTARMQTLNIFAVPLLKSEENLKIEGMRVYVDDTASAVLNSEQSLSYAVLRNVFEGGEVFYENSTYTVNSATAKITAGLVDERLLIDITIKSSPQSPTLATVIRKTLAEIDKDIFGIGNTIEAKYPKIWKKISQAYDNYYKNAEITVKEESDE